MGKLSYDINKGVNRSIEFRGLKAQYIYYLAMGLGLLLFVVSILFIAGVPEYLLLPVVGVAGLVLFTGVYRYSHRYGQYGLMKVLAFSQVPTAILCRSRKVLLQLKPLSNPAYDRTDLDSLNVNVQR